MKVVILAGGYGLRISEETEKRPKPMIEIGGKPILWHIMKGYSYFGFREFIICAGYMQYFIKDWFNNYFLHNSDVTFDFTNEQKQTVIHKQYCEPWKVTVVDTGLNTMTGGRIKRIKPYINEDVFLMTYGDAVCDVDIKKIIEFHISHGKLATLTSVFRDETKGILNIGGNNAVKSFREKKRLDSVAINAGYMVLDYRVFDYINDDNTIFEQDTLERLVEMEELMSYSHTGFWQCMDTLREKIELEELWQKGNAPWKVWKD